MEALGAMRDPGARRRLADRLRTFAPRWLPCRIQRPFELTTCTALTGHYAELCITARSGHPHSPMPLARSEGFLRGRVDVEETPYLQKMRVASVAMHPGARDRGPDRVNP